MEDAFKLLLWWVLVILGLMSRHAGVVVVYTAGAVALALALLWKVSNSRLKWAAVALIAVVTAVVATLVAAGAAAQEENETPAAVYDNNTKARSATPYHNLGLPNSSPNEAPPQTDETLVGPRHLLTWK